MRKKLIRLMLVLTACSVFSPTFAGASAADAPEKTASNSPEWASILPAETPLVVAVDSAENFRTTLFPPDPSKAEFPSLEGILALISETEPKARPPLEAAAKFVNTLLGAFQGSFSLGVGETPKRPTFFFVANLKPEAMDFPQYLSRSVAPLLASLGVKPTFAKEQGVDRMQIGELVVYFITSDSRFLASNDLSSLLRMKQGNLPPESTLAGWEPFRKATAVVPSKGLFLFVDLKGAARLHFGSFSAGTRKALSDLGLGRLEALALSADIGDSSLKISFALTNAGDFTGLPAIFLRPNTATKAVEFVPSDYSLFLRMSVAEALDAYREWQAIVRRMVDDVSWKEYEDALEKLNKERGFSLEDILGQLAGEVALAIKFPDLAGIPPVLAFVAVKDEAKALDAISGLLSRANAAPHSFKTPHGDTIYTTAVIPGVLLSYATKNGYLIVGLSPSCVGSALAASSSGKSLAQEPNFASLTTASPRENLLFAYVDIRHVLRFVAHSVPAVYGLRSMAYSFSHMFPPSDQPDPEREKGTLSPESVKLMQQLYLESERMQSAVVSVASGKDHVSAHAEIPVGMMGRVVSFLTEPLARARESARRARCISNLKQIMVACHTYAADHKGKFPDKLSELYPAYAPSLELFSCPSTGVVIHRPEEIDSMSSYRLIGGFLLKEAKDASKKLVLYESLENHGDGANVAFADSHCKWVQPETLRELLKEAGQ